MHILVKILIKFINDLKRFQKKLEAVAKQKDCGIIGKWQRSIINHLYWCVASSKKDSESVKAKLLSLKKHIHGISTGRGGVFPKCIHGQLDVQWLHQCHKTCFFVMWGDELWGYGIHEENNSCTVTKEKKNVTIWLVGHTVVPHSPHSLK